MTIRSTASRRSAWRGVAVAAWLLALGGFAVSDASYGSTATSAATVATGGLVGTHAPAAGSTFSAVTSAAPASTPAS